MMVPWTRVIVTHKQAGFHRWADAPGEVAYLRDLHRHIFTVRVECGVHHGDRDIEFHTLQRAVRAALTYWENTRREWVFGAMSCEMIAFDVHRVLPEFPILAIEVWEDDECGARVEWANEVPK